jgi:hypothetical protein
MTYGKTVNKHCIRIYWQGEFVGPLIEGEGWSILHPDPDIQEQLANLYAATDAIIDGWKEEVEFIAGKQPLDKIAEEASDPDFSEGFPNTLAAFICDHGDDLKVTAGTLH